MNQQILNALNALLTSLGCAPTSLLAGTAVAPEESATVAGLVYIGAQGPNGNFNVTIVPGGPGTVVALTFGAGDYAAFSGLPQGSAHTVVYYPAAQQAGQGVQSAYDKLISLS